MIESSRKLDQANSEELDQLEIRYRNRKKWLVIASFLFSALLVLTAQTVKETMLYTVVQGLFLSVGYLFVSFIGESQKKLQIIRKHRQSINL